MLNSTDFERTMQTDENYNHYDSNNVISKIFSSWSESKNITSFSEDRIVAKTPAKPSR